MLECDRVFVIKKKRGRDPIQPVSGTKVPRFAGPSTFARLPELRDVEYCDVESSGYHLMQAQVIDLEQDLVLKVLDKLQDI